MLLRKGGRRIEPRAIDPTVIIHTSRNVPRTWLATTAELKVRLWHVRAGLLVDNTYCGARPHWCLPNPGGLLLLLWKGGRRIEPRAIQSAVVRDAADTGCRESTRLPQFKMRPRLRFGLKLLGPLDAAVEDEDVESGQDEGNDKAGDKDGAVCGKRYAARLKEDAEGVRHSIKRRKSR